ncbi:MAG: MFS transporter [Pseudoruegeria sp.]
MHARFAAFAVVLSAAGVPLYIHLPRFVSVELELPLATLGAILLGLRLFDFLQDPALGWIADRPGLNRQALAIIGAIGLAGGFYAVFGWTPTTHVALWLAGALAVVFTCFSLLTILYYGQGVRVLSGQGAAAHYRLAGVREAGTVIGILLAAIIPTLLGITLNADKAFRLFAIGFVVCVLVAVWLMHPIWPQGKAKPHLKHDQQSSVMSALGDGRIRQLLLLGFFNAMPVAATSTLFLFFVEDRLKLANLAGPFLLVFFAAAGLSAPIWSKLGQRFGAKHILVPAMILSILSFTGAALLGEGQVSWFAVICLTSGLALGADMVLLPALFSVTVDQEGVSEGMAFALWSFAAKASLALVAGLVLPVLDRVGFVPSGENTATALGVLTFCYAVLPCVLKCAAIVVLLRITEPKDDTRHREDVPDQEPC